MIHLAILASTLALAAIPSHAINKCIGIDGKPVFQDAPCVGQGQKIDIRPASGHAPAASSTANPTTPAATSTAAQTPAASKKEGAFGPSWQRRRDLESHLINGARGALQSHLQGCETKQRQLARQKLSANNNLAGATWEQSISAEMQAAATMCDTTARDLRARLESYEKELRDLQAKP